MQRILEAELYNYDKVFYYFHERKYYIMAKTIITAALTGAITPHGYDVPETPEEIAKTAYVCAGKQVQLSFICICVMTTAQVLWILLNSTKQSN